MWQKARPVRPRLAAEWDRGDREDLRVQVALRAVLRAWLGRQRPAGLKALRALRASEDPAAAGSR